MAHSTTCSNSFMLTRMGELKRVVVVGAGTMGSQIALQTALSGKYDVILVDSVHGQLERANAQNQKLVDRSVEKGRLTAEQARDAMDFVRSIDRTPVLLRKEIWGFIVNRILFAASEEAIRLLEGGYASAEDIDIAVQKGLNWPMGPFHLLDFSGLDIFYGAMKDR